MTDTLRIEPHPGPQTQAFACPADILVYGGSAGGGKSFYLTVEPLRHVNRKGFNAVIFRATYPRLTQPGGIWDEAREIYGPAGGTPNQQSLTWRFPSSAQIKFGHLDERDLQEHHSSQYAFIGFDECHEMSRRAVFYMMSRLRTTCGISPYMRLTCNPESDSWLAEFIDWWIGEDGYPIAERCGKLRWMIVDGDEIIWSNSREEAVERALDMGVSGEVARTMPLSVSFIAARLEDNPTLEKGDPSYRAKLMALPMVDRERLLGGNWKIRPAAGLLFPRDKWQFCDVRPANLWLCRGWDKAGTEGGKGARTAGVLVGFEPSTERWYVCDSVTGRWSDIERERQIQTTAELDGHKVEIVVEQEPGSGGKESALNTIRKLRGFSASLNRVTGSKASRWRGFASQVQAGNVYIVRDHEWHWRNFMLELDALAGDEKLDGKRLKDQADAASLAFYQLVGGTNQLQGVSLVASGEFDDDDKPVTQEDMDALPDVVRGILETLD